MDEHLKGMKKDNKIQEKKAQPTRDEVESDHTEEFSDEE